MKNARKWFERQKSSHTSIEPPCPYFGECGGCAVQDLDYLDQLKLKREWVEYELNKVGLSSPVEIEGSDELVKKMLFGPWDDEFVVIQSGETFTLDQFYPMDNG